MLYSFITTAHIMVFFLLPQFIWLYCLDFIYTSKSFAMRNFPIVFFPIKYKFYDTISTTTPCLNHYITLRRTLFFLVPCAIHAHMHTPILLTFFFASRFSMKLTQLCIIYELQWQPTAASRKKKYTTVMSMYTHTVYKQVRRENKNEIKNYKHSQYAI